MTENKPIIIDASQCEWRTGVEHCGDYECMLNKCCDYNCDWYKRRKFEQQFKIKEQECERLKEENFTFEQLIKEYEKYGAIEEIIQQLDHLKTENERLQKTQFCFAYEKDCYKVCKQQNCIIKNGYKAEQKLEKIRQICNCSKSQMNCEQCPMCDECEELCVNDENLQDIILQIIDEMENV